MLSEWSAECGAYDPVVVVPWASPDGVLRWIDLRDDPDALDNIAEADEFPALLAALRALNGPRSHLFTSKCDAWSMDGDELFTARMDLLLENEVALAGFTSYIDLLPRDRAIFVSRPRVEGLLYWLDRVLREQPFSLALVQSVLRPAVVELDGTVAEGYAVTVYVKGVGVDAEEAALHWDEALRAVAALLRSRDLSAG